MKTVIRPLATLSRLSPGLRRRMGSRHTSRAPGPPISSRLLLVWRTMMRAESGARKANGRRKMTSPASGPLIVHRHTHLTQQIFSTVTHHAKPLPLSTGNTALPHRMAGVHRIERLIVQLAGGAGRVTTSVTSGKPGRNTGKVRAVRVASSKPGTQLLLPPGPREAASRTTAHRLPRNPIGGRASKASALQYGARPTASACDAHAPRASTPPLPPRPVVLPWPRQKSGFRFRIPDRLRSVASNSNLFTRGLPPHLIRFADRRPAPAPQTSKRAVGDVATVRWCSHDQVEHTAPPPAVEKVWRTSAVAAQDIAPPPPRAPMSPAYHDAVAPPFQAVQPPATPHAAASTNTPLDQRLVERLTEEVARNIEKRLRIERERRGL